MNYLVLTFLAFFIIAAIVGTIVLISQRRKLDSGDDVHFFI